MSVSELACTYAALILHDDNVDITADNIQKVVTAANVEVEPYWPGLYAKLFEKKSVEDFLSGVGAAPAAAAGPATGGAPAAADRGAPAAKEEAKKAEPEPESDEDMGFSLFD